MPRPQLYVNVSQTIAVSLAATTILSYIFNIKGFRDELNRTLMCLNGGAYRG